MEKLAFVGVFAVFGLLGMVIPEAEGLEILANWGLAGVVVAFVLWRDWAREKRMSKALDQRDSWIRGTLVDVIDRNTKAMGKCAAKQAPNDG